MGKALNVVNRFYELTNKRQTKGLEEMIDKGIIFAGPLIKTSGAKQFIELNEQFLPFHRGVKMFKQFENDDDVCSIYELKASTPAGRNISLLLANWIRVSQGKIVEQRIYYDPREFAKAFGM